MFQRTPMGNSAWWSIDEIGQSCHRLYFYFLVLAFQIKLMAHDKQLFRFIEYDKLLIANA